MTLTGKITFALLTVDVLQPDTGSCFNISLLSCLVKNLIFTVFKWVQRSACLKLILCFQIRLKTCFPVSHEVKGQPAHIMALGVPQAHSGSALATV